MANWTLPELDRLRREFPVKSRSALISSFPFRSWGSIKSTAYALGLRKSGPRGIDRWREVAANHKPTIVFRLGEAPQEIVVSQKIEKQDEQVAIVPPRMKETYDWVEE